MASANDHAETYINLWGSTLMLLTPLLLMAGMVLGISALRDIRKAGGQLAGAIPAAFAVCLLPALLICGLSAVAMETLGQELKKPGANVSRWVAAGWLMGLGASALLLRHAYRWATPWQRHEPMSPLASVSVALSIFGMVGLLLLPGARLPGVVEIAVPALCLLGGLVCGILSRRERAGLLGAIASGGGLMILLLVTA
jgi:hypothetical protein